MGCSWQFLRIQGGAAEGPFGYDRDSARKVSDFAFRPVVMRLYSRVRVYDFGIAGPITDAVQCLEWTEALNSAIHSESRNS
jgi:hypothetical protein